MPDALSEKVLACIDGAEALYHRLILVAGPSGAGKTEALQRVAESVGAPHVNLNLELSRRMLDLTGRERSLRLPDLLDEVVGRDAPHRSHGSPHDGAAEAAGALGSMSSNAPGDGRLQLIAVIEDPAVIERILRHLGLPTDIPEARSARPPPMPFLLDSLATAGGEDQILVDTRS